MNNNDSLYYPSTDYSYRECLETEKHRSSKLRACRWRLQSTVIITVSHPHPLWSLQQQQQLGAGCYPLSHMHATHTLLQPRRRRRRNSICSQLSCLPAALESFASNTRATLSHWLTHHHSFNSAHCFINLAMSALCYRGTDKTPHNKTRSAKTPTGQKTKAVFQYVGYVPAWKDVINGYCARHKLTAMIYINKAVVVITSLMGSVTLQLVNYQLATFYWTSANHWS